MSWSGRVSVVDCCVCGLLPVSTRRANKRALDRPPDKKSKLYFVLILCLQQGLNTRQHEEFFVERHDLTTKNSRFVLGI